MKNFDNHENNNHEICFLKYKLLLTYIVCGIVIISLVGLIGVLSLKNNLNNDDPSEEETTIFDEIKDFVSGDNSADAEDNVSDEEDSSNNNEEIIVEPIDFSNLTYTAIGDSITYGFCGDHAKPPFTNNYPSCLKAYLGLENVTNLGVCGCLVSRSTNPAYTSMIDKVDLISADTDIISVFGGINDYATYAVMGDINSNDEYTIYGALNAIASKLKTQFPDAFVFFITPLPISSSNITDINNNAYTVRDVCNAILEVGAKWDIPVYDANLYADFDTEKHSFDGCHPTEAYYSTIFSAKLIEFIEENYRKQ